jgi:hypothetical protein
MASRSGRRNGHAIEAVNASPQSAAAHQAGSSRKKLNAKGCSSNNRRGTTRNSENLNEKNCSSELQHYRRYVQKVSVNYPMHYFLKPPDRRFSFFEFSLDLCFFTDDRKVSAKVAGEGSTLPTCCFFLFAPWSKSFTPVGAHRSIRGQAANGFGARR